MCVRAWKVLSHSWIGGRHICVGVIAPRDRSASVVSLQLICDCRTGDLLCRKNLKCDSYVKNISSIVTPILTLNANSIVLIRLALTIPSFWHCQVVDFVDPGQLSYREIPDKAHRFMCLTVPHKSTSTDIRNIFLAFVKLIEIDLFSFIYRFTFLDQTGIK